MVHSVMTAPAGLVDQQILKMRNLFHSSDMSQVLQVKPRMNIMSVCIFNLLEFGDVQWYHLSEKC